MEGPDADIHNNDRGRWDMFGNNHFHKKPGLKYQQAGPAWSIWQVPSHLILVQTCILRLRGVVEGNVLAMKSTGGQINKCWYNHTLEYSGAIKKYDEKVYFLRRWGGERADYITAVKVCKKLYMCPGSKTLKRLRPHANSGALQAPAL